MADELLILHPAGATGVSLDALRDLLTAAELLGDAFDFFGDVHHHRGASWDSYFVQRDAHQVVTLDANAPPVVSTSDEHIHIQLEETADVEFIGSALTESPHCPGCGHAFEMWPDVLERWYADRAAAARCPGCGESHLAPDLDGKHRAGFAPVSLRVWDVRPGELEVTPTLFSLLEKETDARWGWLYFRL